MEITGTQVIPAMRSRVWDALNDPSILKACLPGCESVERDGPEAFKVVVAAAVGPLRARFNGALKITQAQAPESCVLVFEGQGGAMGFGKGSSSVTLREIAQGTEVLYSAKAQVGGKLAQVGSRLIDGVARKMSDDFFEALRKHTQPSTTPTDAGARGSDEKSTAELPLPTESAEPVVRMADVPSHSAARGAASAAPAMVMRMVPAWWLAVATALGSATTIAGALFLR
jgi:carbon monoxide dehydrogenase subunit G